MKKEGDEQLMHAMCTIVGRTIREIENCIDYYQTENAWDYVSIGGRYSNLLPVSKKCKVYHTGMGWPDIPRGIFPYPERMIANPDLYYANIARIRNINMDEVARVREGGGLDPFEPYTLIICHDDGGYEWIDMEEIDNGRFVATQNFLHDIRRQSWFMAILDYHY